MGCGFSGVGDRFSFCSGSFCGSGLSEWLVVLEFVRQYAIYRVLYGEIAVMYSDWDVIQRAV